MADPLIPRLKHLIVETLRLEDIKPEDIQDDAPLIGSGLSLDSIDAVELVVKLEKEFGIKSRSSEESHEAWSRLVGFLTVKHRLTAAARIAAESLFRSRSP